MPEHYEQSQAPIDDPLGPGWGLGPEEHLLPPQGGQTGGGGTRDTLQDWGSRFASWLWDQGRGAVEGAGGGNPLLGAGLLGLLGMQIRDQRRARQDQQAFDQQRLDIILENLARAEEVFDQHAPLRHAGQTAMMEGMARAHADPFQGYLAERAAGRPVGVFTGGMPGMQPVEGFPGGADPQTASLLEALRGMDPEEIMGPGPDEQQPGEELPEGFGHGDQVQDVLARLEALWGEGPIHSTAQQQAYAQLPGSAQQHFDPEDIRVGRPRRRDRATQAAGGFLQELL